MATGEKRWSSEGKQATGPKGFPVIPKGEYDFKFKTNARIGKSDKPDSVPYVLAWMTTELPNGETHTHMEMFHCSLKPGKDGKVMPERVGGILELAQAVGAKLDLSVLSQPTSDGKGEIDYLSPNEVIEFLNDLGNNGDVVRAGVKVEPATKDFSEKNKIAYWVIPEQ